MLRGTTAASALLLAPVFGAAQDRVELARQLKETELRQGLQRLGMTYPPDAVYIRAFKRERQLELWVRGSKATYLLFKTYRVAAASGGLGPKLREGDLQVPEGLYHVDRYNPRSRFHLSLGINYPNATDRHRSRGLDPGGDIFIHGARASIGCLAMTDEFIREIYLLALDARMKPVRVHIFPMRMEGSDYRKTFDSAPAHWRELWSMLQSVYTRFEKTRRL